MKGALHPLLRVPLLAAIIGLLAWWLVPGTRVDQTVFETLSRSFANPPFFVTGSGSHADPWKLRTFSSQARPKSAAAPVVVALGDDVDGFFQSSPPSPIDLAVVLTNFQRLGAKRAATAAVLAWDEPDPIGLAALDKVIGRFDSLVMAAPLARAASPELMPPSFRRASIPVRSVRGDVSGFPVVNRIPLTGVILGGENTLAGFQSLDSAVPGRAPFLVARWEDRLVFSFPVIAALQRLRLPVDELIVRPGKFIQLGSGGPITPMDAFGRMRLPVTTTPPAKLIAAEDIIDASPGIFPSTTDSQVVLADHRSMAEPATRSFSADLPFMVATVTSGGLASIRVHERLAPRNEILALLGTTLLVSCLARLPVFTRMIAFLGVAALVVSVQVLANSVLSVWLPGLTALAVAATAFGGSFLRFADAPVRAIQAPQPAPRKPSRRPAVTAAPTPEEHPPPPAADAPASEVAKPTKSPKPKPQPAKPPRSGRRKKR